MNALQKALTANTIFSSISGMIMVLLNRQIAHLFGTDNNTVFWVVGLALIFFAITIWYEITRQRKLAVLWIVTQDFIWVLGSIILVIFNPFHITQMGNVIIGIVALIVLYMGINQMTALNRSTTKAV
ncbi:MAG: hypothetical protein OCD76_13990 [Reichenbachiella sp.]